MPPGTLQAQTRAHSIEKQQEYERIKAWEYRVRKKAQAAAQ